MRNILSSIFCNLILFLANLWQKTRGFRLALMLGQCRFYPSCSDYLVKAIKSFGFKGIWLSVKRLLKCHPLNSGGIDEIQCPCSTEA